MVGIADQAALDTLRVSLEGEISQDKDVFFSKSEMYCGKEGVRISIIEYMAYVGRRHGYLEESTVRMLVAYRFVNGLGVRISSGSTVPTSLGIEPLDLRQKMLMWMSAIRTIEK